MTGYKIKNEGIYQNVNKYMPCDRSLKYCPNGTCGIIEGYVEREDGKSVPIQILLSYSSTIAYYSPLTRHFIILAGDWSTTTAKHINAFMRECGIYIHYGEIRQKTKKKPYVINPVHRTIISYEPYIRDECGDLVMPMTDELAKKLIADDLDAWWVFGEFADRTLYY